MRPDRVGDWGQARVYLGSGDTTLYVTVNQRGIHKGQKAHTFWEIYHPAIGKTEHT
ncbi:hypothetical protein ACQKP0_00490 [Heyndrickxia sp. NPDC080065]|uniref:hypothetical protein n=1 Tax=Heyndrickxia sp. NPDC080065 TaxID=3390568 RepID=UPI003CFC0A7E